MNTLILSLQLTLVIIGGCFLAGLLTRNYSWVDRLWSIMPPVYVIIWSSEFSHEPGYLIVSALIIAWGLRLTWNFAMKGGYRFSWKEGFSGEDYRWEHMREVFHNRTLFELFNLLFISTYQLLLIFLFTLPVYFYGKAGAPLTGTIRILFLVQVLLLLGETTADLQQLRFHRRKHLSPWKDDRRYQIGFNTFGLWSISRHPNYVCEMGQWVVVYLYAYTALGHHHPSGLGALLLILLFAGSTRLTERISVSKYPEYRSWQDCTSVWIPFRSLWKHSARRKEFAD